MLNKCNFGKIKQAKVITHPLYTGVVPSNNGDVVRKEDVYGT